MNPYQVEYCWKCPYCGYKLLMASSSRRVCPKCHSSVDKYGTIRTKAEIKENSGTNG